MMVERIGNKPIQPELYEPMNSLAQVLDEVLNGEKKGEDREWGFVLLVFPFGTEPRRCNYVSSARREDVKVLLREQLAYFEGQAENEGRG